MKRTHGFALPLVLWALGVLAAALVTATVFLDLSMQAQLATAKAGGARQLALSGIAFAMAAQPPNLPYTAKRKIEGEGDFSVTRSSDSARINLNALLKKKDAVAIAKVLLAMGGDVNKSKIATAALLHRTWLQSGGDGSTFTGFIPFESFAQLQSIPEFTDAVGTKADWRDLLTLWGSGNIDVNYAGPEVLMALGGLNASQANTLIQARTGPDGVAGTKDDVKLTSMENVVTMLGLSADAAVQLRTYFGIKTEIDRVAATGEIRGMQRKIQVIAKEDGTPIAWDEE